MREELPWWAVAWYSISTQYSSAHRHWDETPSRIYLFTLNMYNDNREQYIPYLLLACLLEEIGISVITFNCQWYENLRRDQMP